MIFSTHLVLAQTCESETVYANKKQTKYDNRFSEYQKIRSVPKYKGGQKKFQQFLRENLIVIPEFRNQVLMLNYRFTISCNGAIQEVITLGDKRFGEITNFREIIQDTKNKWKPAKVNGQEVNCIYFGTMFVNGSLYQK